IDLSARSRLEEVLRSSIESESTEYRALAAEAKLSSRLRWMVRLTSEVSIDQDLVTNVEYQLFLDQMQEQHEYYSPDHWTAARFPIEAGVEPVVGVRPSDAQRFCKWLSHRDLWFARYRLPTTEETPVDDTAGEDRRAYWVTQDEEAVLHATWDVSVLLRIEQRAVTGQLEDDLYRVLRLRSALDRSGVQRPPSRITLERRIPSAEQAGARGDRHLALREQFEDLRRDMLLLEKYEQFANDLGPKLDVLMRSSEAFLQTQRDKLAFLAWLSLEDSVHCLSEFDLGGRLDTTLAYFAGLPRHVDVRESGTAFGSQAALLDSMVDALAALKSRAWAGASEEPGVQRDAYEYLRWYVRMGAGSLGAFTASRKTPSDRATKPFQQQLRRVCEELIRDLILLEKRIQGEVRAFEGIRLVKVQSR
ncbi:SUMF1/EgtB/PvdO family nonheme iron enzyme, partial [Chloroflexota bacterium]